MIFLDVLDLFGTFVFAISGAFRAVKYELDVLGVSVLAVSTGIGGGIIRDLLLGNTPPEAVISFKYVVICLVAVFLAFIATGKIARRWNVVMIADAVGLGVFAAIGASKAQDASVGVFGVILMAAITATGGGVVRDILVREIPMILVSDFYASAAIAGGTAFIVFDYFGCGREISLAGAILVTTLLRFAAMWFNFSLPKIKSLPASPSELTKLRKNNKN